MPIPEPLRDYAASLGFAGSETLARIFEILYDGEHDVKLVAALPGTAKEVAGKTGLPEEFVSKALRRLLLKGALIVSFKDLAVFRRFPAMIELRDSSVVAEDTPPELLRLWEKLVTQESKPFIAMLNQRQIAPMVRVIPIERSVEAANRVLDIDSARKIFQDAGLITAMPCVCRKVAKANGRGQDCPAPASAVCLQTNFFAAGVQARGLGEKLTTAEALRRIGAAEDAGLVHMVRNNVKKDMFMCNCCSCCCTGLYFLQELGLQASVAPSRFRVKLDQNRCSSCGVCEDRCQFHAIAMNEFPEIELSKCFGCGNCVITCPEQALVLEEIRPENFIRVK